MSPAHPFIVEYRSGELSLAAVISNATNAEGKDVLDATSSWTHGTYDGAARIVAVTVTRRGVVIGRLLAGCDSNPLEIDKVWVSRGHRRRGMAVKMLNFAMVATGLNTAYAPNPTSLCHAWLQAISSPFIADGELIDRYTLPGAKASHL